MRKRLLNVAALVVVLLGAGSGCRSWCDRWCNRDECYDHPRLYDPCADAGHHPAPRVLNYADDCR